MAPEVEEYLKTLEPGVQLKVRLYRPTIRYGYIRLQLGVVLLRQNDDNTNNRIRLR